jgi:glycerol-3-phosphate acyltransferase PlsY
MLALGALSLATPLPALPTGGEWLAVLASYLLGAVPFGWVMARWLHGVDLRTFGSGNIGATNAGRVLGRPLGLVAFLLDFAKGLVPVLVLAPAFSSHAEGALAGWWQHDKPSELRLLQVLCGAAAVCGHVWPVYLRFRGGKAVATGCGALLALDPLVFAGGGLVWLAVLAASRYAGLASIAMGATFPLLAWLRADRAGYGGEVVGGALALALLIAVRHRSNMARMLAGTEPKVGSKKKLAEPRSMDRSMDRSADV